uniref:Uncharacterized protein n=1 Tax=Arundo donax TaxID=35708 RepID=A0A0A9FGM1_ARUDO
MVGNRNLARAYLHGVIAAVSMLTSSLSSNVIDAAQLIFSNSSSGHSCSISSTSSFEVFSSSCKM